MPWAAHNIISTDPIEGGIEITEYQYLEALEAMGEGLIVNVDDGVLRFVKPQSPPEPETEPSHELADDESQEHEGGG